MKKTLILLGVLAMSYTYAQEGKVGINTESPQATLEVTPSNANLAGTTNEGIIAPKLTKDRIANIAAPVEGTLVYATDANYGGANAVVSKITEKGYYFFNGTEWVKASGASGATTGVSSNIYTADGTLTGDRIVDTGSNDLTIKGNSWFPLIIQSTIDGGAGNKASGGLAVYADDFNKRVEFGSTKDGDIRLWAGDGVSKMFIERATGNVGISADDPKAKLDVRGGVRALPGIPAGDASNVGYAFGNDGDTGLFATVDAANTNVGTGLDLYLNNESRLNINPQGAVKIANLSGTGERLVVAGADGTLKTGSVSASSLSGAGNITGTGISVGNGTGAALKNVTLEIENNAITADKLASMGATNGQVLKWNGTAWAPAADEVGGSTATTPGAYIVPDTSIVVVESGTSYTVQSTDYYISVNGPTDEVTIIVPEASKAKGRKLVITNRTSTNVAISDGKNQAINGSQSPSINLRGTGMTIISDGKSWYNLINY